MKPHVLAVGAVIGLLGACATSSLKETWKSPEFQKPPGKIAVLVIAERGLLRQGFENRLASELIARGSPSLTTYDLMSLAEIKADKRGAADRLSAGGADGLLLVRLVDRTSSYREVRPGAERYASVVTGVETMGWYDYLSLGFMELSPTYGNVTDRLYVESGLYDLKTEKRVWSGLTQTVLKEDMDRIAEMDPLVARIVSAMHKDGVIR